MDASRTSSSIIDSFSVTNVARVLVLWLAYLLARALYNVSPLHPLSHIPGPKAAAFSEWYQAWFDLVLGGQYCWEIKKMHEQYGPIVRISPDELHFNDPNFIDEVYASGGRKRNKYGPALRVVVGPHELSGFGTREHDLHRVRRAPLNRFFSRQQILKLEPEINRLVQTLCDKLLRSTPDQPFEITEAFSCFTADLISDYCFGEPLGYLNQSGWTPNYREALYAMLDTAYLFRYAPWTRVLVNIAPLAAKHIGGSVGRVMSIMYEEIPKHVQKARDDKENGVMRDRPTVFVDVLNSPLPDSEKTVYRLTGEGAAFMAAGTETVSWTLSVLTYYLLANPAMLDQLTKELNEAVPDARNLTWSALEKLPYFSAVLNEGLRLSYGVTSRSPRVADEVLVYRGEWAGHGKVECFIPRGAAISTSTPILHHNEIAFPDSHIFKPERWIDEQGQRRRELEKCLFSFSRGTRQCLGMTLSYCELYLALAALTLRVLPRLKLFETSVEDVTFNHDMVAPMPKKGSQGVRVAIV